MWLFDENIARAYGVNAAHVLAFMQNSLHAEEWQGDSSRDADGFFWISHSYERIADILGYLTKGQVRGAVLALEEEGVLISEMRPESGSVKYYRVDHDRRREVVA